MRKGNQKGKKGTRGIKVNFPMGEEDPPGNVPGPDVVRPDLLATNFADHVILLDPDLIIVFVNRPSPGLSTEELVVRELGGGKSDVSFHFVVHGLRVGFEEISAVQAKPEDLKIPNMDEHRQARQADAEIRASVPLDRFLRMESNVKGTPPEEADLSRAHALRDAIGEKGK